MRFKGEKTLNWYFYIKVILLLTCQPIQYNHMTWWGKWHFVCCPSLHCAWKLVQALSINQSNYSVWFGLVRKKIVPEQFSILFLCTKHLTVAIGLNMAKSLPLRQTLINAGFFTSHADLLSSHCRLLYLQINDSSQCWNYSLLPSPGMLDIRVSIFCVTARNKGSIQKLGVFLFFFDQNNE